MSKKKKPLWAIIIITISLVVFLYLILPSRWFWISWECIAVVLVAFGCCGEFKLALEEKPKTKSEAEHHRRELRFVLMVSIGVTAEVIGLGHTIIEGIKLEEQVATAALQAAQASERAEKLEQTNLRLKTDLETLNKSVIELAHLYDMSTNALAEANKRLATIPLPRDLSKDQQNVLFIILTTIPRVNVSFATDQGVTDGVPFMKKLIPVFSTAGWKIEKVSSGVHAGIGEGISVRGPKEVGLQVKAIAHTLKSLGLNASGSTNEPPKNPNAKFDTNLVSILIGYNRK